MKNFVLPLRLSGFLTAIFLGSIVIASACVANADVVNPPGITKVFLAATTTPGTPVGLEFIISNPNPIATLTNVKFTDFFPAGMEVSTPTDLSASGACSVGDITAPDGSTSIQFLDPSLGPSQSCTFQLDVIALFVSTYTNTVVITSDQGGQNSSSATLSVVPAPPVPEPSSMLLLGTGALGLFGPIRRKLLPYWTR